MLQSNSPGPNLTEPIMASKPARVLFSGLLILSAALVLQTWQKTDAANADSPVATYLQGTLRVTIPYRAARAGAGQLTVEVVNPEDEVLGRVERATQADIGKAQWQAELKL